jgi:ppGpp synthetase/RelA/SpoT-type nucleotidyltranferase
VLQDAVRKMSGNRHEIVSQMEARIDARLREEDIKARVVGRNKHLWGIYRKMRGKPPLPFRERPAGPAPDADRLSSRKTKPFKEVYDVYAVRIIVDSVDTCYRVLGVMHSLYKPIMGRFKDYIAIPKANGYQSLHTVLFGPGGVPIELQIRTEEMHVMAEVGVAAHWRYKSGGEGGGGHAQQRAREWLRKLLDMQRRAGNPVEFLESVKVDLFPDEVYVFTPRGEIIELPRGATAVDFAYAIHSDVGNTCVGARVDRRLVPLRTPLVTGQTVEAIITPTARPNPAWLNFVVTAKARASIRHYLKHLQRGEATLLGKRLLEKALAGRIGNLNELPPERIKALVREFNLSGFDELLADIGLGNRVAALIAKRLLPAANPRNPSSGRQRPTAADQGHRRHGGQLRQMLPAVARRRHHRLPQHRARHRHPPGPLQERHRLQENPREMDRGGMGARHHRRLPRGIAAGNRQQARRAGHHRRRHLRDRHQHRNHQHLGAGRPYRHGASAAQRPRPISSGPGDPPVAHFARGPEAGPARLALHRPTPVRLDRFRPPFSATPFPADRRGVRQELWRCRAKSSRPIKPPPPSAPIPKESKSAPPSTCPARSRSTRPPSNWWKAARISRFAGCSTIWRRWRGRPAATWPTRSSSTCF